MIAYLLLSSCEFFRGNEDVVVNVARGTHQPMLLHRGYEVNRGTVVPVSWRDGSAVTGNIQATRFRLVR